MKRIGGSKSSNSISKEPKMINVTHICHYYIVNSHIKITIKEKILS